MLFIPGPLKWLLQNDSGIGSMTILLELVFGPYIDI